MLDPPNIISAVVLSLPLPSPVPKPLVSPLIPDRRECSSPRSSRRCRSVGESMTEQIPRSPTHLNAGRGADRDSISHSVPVALVAATGQLDLALPMCLPEVAGACS